MSAPKFNSYKQKEKQVKSSYRTVCKKVCVSNDLLSEIDNIIASMEVAGYDYYDNIDGIANEKVLIFKIIR